jgi:hypothetical protein
VKQLKTHVDTFVDNRVIPLPVAFSKNRYVITVILVLSVASLFLYTNQTFTNFVSCVFNGLGTLVALIIAYEADKNAEVAMAARVEIDRRGNEDHEALMELLTELHRHNVPKSMDESDDQIL